MRPRFDPWIRKIPWRREWLPIPVFLPGESHGQRSLVVHNLWGRERVGHDWANKHIHERERRTELSQTGECGQDHLIAWVRLFSQPTSYRQAGLSGKEHTAAGETPLLRGWRDGIHPMQEMQALSPPPDYQLGAIQARNSSIPFSGTILIVLIL